MFEYFDTIYIGQYSSSLHTDDTTLLFDIIISTTKVSTDVKLTEFCPLLDTAVFYILYGAVSRHVMVEGMIMMVLKIQHQ